MQTDARVLQCAEGKRRMPEAFVRMCEEISVVHLSGLSGCQFCMALRAAIAAAKVLLDVLRQHKRILP